MTDLVMKKIISSIAHDAKTTLMNEGAIPVIWNMITDDLVYQVSKTISSPEDELLAMELVYLSKKSLKPKSIVQVLNTNMAMTEDESKNSMVEALLIIIHHPNMKPESLISKIFRDENGNVTMFSHYHKNQMSNFEVPIINPYGNEIISPSKESIEIVERMLRIEKTPRLRLVH